MTDRMSKRTLAVLAFVAAGSVACAAQAAEIGVGDFTSPVIQGFGNPNSTGGAAAPLAIANYAFTSFEGPNLLWYSANNDFNNCVGGCVAGLGGGLNVDLGGDYALAGLYVGQVTAYSLNVSFYNAANVLLGTVVASGDDGLSFAGWESAGDKIASIKIAQGLENTYLVVAQSGYLQAGAAVPEPAAWALMIAGFGLAGAALRRRWSMAAA